MSKQSDLINGTFTDSIDVTGTVVADGLTVDGSGGQVTTDNNGFIISKQLLDVETAGGRFIGKSNRGELGHIAIEQTATSADGGYIRFATSPAGSTTPADRMMIDSAGRVTMPYQPAFFVMMNNANITSSAVIIWNNVFVNTGSHYSTSNGRFTAPVAGRYLFSFYALKRSGTGRLSVQKNGGYYGAGTSQTYSGGIGSGETMHCASAIVDLAVNDYVQIYAQIDSGDFYGNNNSHNGFTGHLIG